MDELRQPQENKKQVKVKSTNTAAVKAVIIIIACIIIFAVVLCFYFNIAGVRGKLAEWIAPNHMTDMVMNERQENQKIFDSQQAQIAEEKLKLEQREGELDKLAAELEEKQQQLDELRKAVDQKNTEIQSMEQDIRNVAKIYEEMEADVAARVLMSYEDKNEVARIIRGLSDEKAAAVLSEMEAKYASGLLHIVDSQN